MGKSKLIFLLSFAVGLTGGKCAHQGNTDNNGGNKSSFHHVPEKDGDNKSLKDSSNKSLEEKNHFEHFLKAFENDDMEGMLSAHNEGLDWANDLPKLRSWMKNKSKSEESATQAINKRFDAFFANLIQKDDPSFLEATLKENVDVDKSPLHRVDPWDCLYNNRKKVVHFLIANMADDLPSYYSSTTHEDFKKKVDEYKHLVPSWEWIDNLRADDNAVDLEAYVYAKYAQGGADHEKRRERALTVAALRTYPFLNKGKLSEVNLMEIATHQQKWHFTEFFASHSPYDVEQISSIIQNNFNKLDEDVQNQYPFLKQFLKDCGDKANSAR